MATSQGGASSPGPLRVQTRLGHYALLYLLFIVYGSLVPLNFVDRPFHEALAAFSPPNWLALGPGDRADWVANLVLYLPLSFLALAANQGGRSRTLNFPRAIGLLFSLGLLAVVIEFLQLFFPPRTVSLNDLVAEGAGIILGGLAWVVAGNRFLSLSAAGFQDRFGGRRAVAAVFIAAYLLLALFPFDLIVSAGELHSKLASDLVGLWVAPIACSSAANCFAHSALEFCGGALFGLAWHWLRRRTAIASPLEAVQLGLVFGVGVEFLQVFFTSGVSQGASAVVRCVGIALGYRYASEVPRIFAAGLHWRGARWWLWVGSLGYLVTLFLVNGWFRTSFGTVPEALDRLQDLQFLPFYYYYYVSEQWALLSASVEVAMYAPVGILVALAAGRWHFQRKSLGWIAAILAALLALVIEVGKPFLGKRPDPTDVLLALWAGYIAYRVTAYLISLVGIAGDANRLSPVAPSQPSRLAAFGPGTVLGTILLLAVALGVFRYSVGSAWLAAALVIYSVTLLRKPSAWLLMLPALLPVLDLAPWTGQFFFDEFDLVLLLTLGIRLLKPAAGAASDAGPGRSGRVSILWLVVGMSWLASAAVSLWPLSAIDVNAFADYYSPYNALRVGKGFFWAAALALLAWRDRFELGTIVRRVTLGMSLGLAATVGVVVWERCLFPGLFNFALDYRVTGPFSSMHFGGAYLDAYLVIAAPFAVLFTFRTPGVTARLFGLVLLVLTGYAVAVTFSRGTVVAFVVAIVLTLLGIAIAALRGGAPNLGRRALLALGVLAGTTVVAFPVISGSFFQERFEHITEDVSVRTKHWEQALAMMDETWRARLIGMGLGSYPSISFWRGEPSVRPATYRVEHDAANPYLRFGAGSGIYLEQVISLEPDTTYLLSFRARSKEPKAQITIVICQKWLLTSFNCDQQLFDVASGSADWHPFERQISSGQLGAGPWYMRRPVKLALYNPSGTILDMDDVRMLDEHGTNIIANGDFSSGSTRWFPSSDDHLPWHIKNLWVHLFFEQGWVGALALSALVFMILARLAVRMVAGADDAGAIFAAVAGALVVGMVDTVVDVPRLALLLYLLLLIGDWRGRVFRT